MRITMLAAVVWLIAGSPVYAQDNSSTHSGALASTKQAYLDRLAAAGKESVPRWDGLNAEYKAGLADLVKSYRQKGDLDALLATRAEVARFEKEKKVTGDNVVLMPPELTDAQRRYLVSYEKIRQDQDQRSAKITQAYLALLNDMKRELTRQGNLADAIAVNEEIKTMQAAAESAPANPPVEPPPPPARPSAPAAPTAPSACTNVTRAPDAIKPLHDHIWLFAVRKGFSVRDVPFLFISSAGKQIMEQRTDATGKVDYRTTQPGETCRILLLSDHYDLVDIKSAKGGEAYQIKLADVRFGTGVLRVTDKIKEITLPGAGKLRVQTWSSSNGGTGAALMGTEAVFHWKDGGNENRFVFAKYEEPFQIINGAEHYEVTLYQLASGLNFYVRWTTVP